MDTASIHSRGKCVSVRRNVHAGTKAPLAWTQRVLSFRINQPKLETDHSSLYGGSKERGRWWAGQSCAVSGERRHTEQKKSYGDMEL